MAETSDPTLTDRANMVGPVLTSSATTDAIVEAIQNENEGVVVEDRGAYRRILVPDRCEVRKEAIEAVLGREFRFPGELEIVMSTFKGRLTLDEDRAVWSA